MAFHGESTSVLATHADNDEREGVLLEELLHAAVTVERVEDRPATRNLHRHDGAHARKRRQVDGEGRNGPRDLALRALKDAQRVLDGLSVAAKARGVQLTSLSSADARRVKYQIVHLAANLFMFAITLGLTISTGASFYRLNAGQFSSGLLRFSSMYYAALGVRAVMLLTMMRAHTEVLLANRRELSQGVPLSAARRRGYLRRGAEGAMLELEIRLCERRLRFMRFAFASAFLSDLTRFGFALYAVSGTQTYFNAAFAACLLADPGYVSPYHCSQTTTVLAVLDVVLALLVFVLRLRELPQFLPEKLRLEMLRGRLRQENESASVLESLRLEAASAAEISAAVDVRKVIQLETSSLAPFCNGLSERALDMWTLRCLRASKGDSLDAVLSVASWLRWRADNGSVRARERLMRGEISWATLPGVGALSRLVLVSDVELAPDEERQLIVRVQPNPEPTLSANSSEVSPATVVHMLEWLLCVTDALSEQEQRIFDVLQVDLEGFTSTLGLEGDLSLASYNACRALEVALESFPLRIEVHVHGCERLAIVLRALVPSLNIIDKEPSGIAGPLALAPPTTVPAKIGRLGNELDLYVFGVVEPPVQDGTLSAALSFFLSLTPLRYLGRFPVRSLACSLLRSFLDVTEVERETVALVQLMIAALERHITETFSFDSDEAPSSGKPELSRFIVRADHAYKVQAANLTRLERMAIPHEPESEEAWATQCSLLMAKVLQKAGPARHLPRELGGTIEALRFVRAYQQESGDGDMGSPLYIASLLLASVWRLCDSSRLQAVYSAIKSQKPHLFAAQVPQSSSVVWPAHHEKPPRRQSSAEFLAASLMSGKLTAKVVAVAGPGQRLRPTTWFPASPLNCGDSGMGMGPKASQEVAESRDRFTHIAADFGLRPLLTFSPGIAAHTSGLLFDESAVRKHDVSALVAYWGETGRVKVAFEWLFEFLETMLNAMSVKNGRICYLQPIFKLDGSHPELRELVLETLHFMNRERYPPVFRGPPIVVLAGDFSQAAYLKRASAHYAEARIVQLSDLADARREIEAAGLDPAMLPVGLGGSRPDLAPPGFTSSDLPSLGELLEGSLVLPPPLHESGNDPAGSGSRVNRRGSRLVSAEWLGSRQVIASRKSISEG